MTIVENSLQGVRAEWVEEKSVGVPPIDPQWNKFSDYLDEGPGWSNPDLTEENTAVGSGDVVDITRGAEDTHEFTIQYWAQRALVDGSGNVQDPIAFPFLHDYTEQYTTHTIVWRREVTSGGADGAGYRVYTVGLGAKPVGATIPGDPGEASPQSLELSYEAEYGRSHRIDQPAADSTVEIVSTNTDDTAVSVTVEDEGAGTTETIQLNGTTAVETTETFADIDVVYIQTGTPKGDITVQDPSDGTVYTTLQGTNTNGVDYDIGIPPLESGSHASDIGNDPGRYLGLNTSSAYGGNLIIPERVHQFDLAAEIDTDTNAQQGTRRPTIDIGTRTVTAEADVASEDASTQQTKSYLQGYQGDITYALGGTSTGSGVTDITLEAGQITDVDDQSFGAGDANNIFGVTYTAQDANAAGGVVSMTNTT
jgi:hypothetical protein